MNVYTTHYTGKPGQQKAAQKAKKPAPAPSPTPDPVSALRGRCAAALATPEAWSRPRQALALALAAPLEGDALRAILKTLPTDAACGAVDFAAAGAGETDAAALADAKRIAAILSLSEAEGRTAHAVTFAIQTSMTPDQAKAVLARLPKAAPVQTIAQRAEAEDEFGAGGGDDLAAGGRGASSADRAWSRAITGINGKVAP